MKNKKILKAVAKELERKKEFCTKAQYLVNNLGWDRDRMSKSGQENYDKLSELLNKTRDDIMFAEADIKKKFADAKGMRLIDYVLNEMREEKNNNNKIN